ncbi:zinc-binding dehydrogenase [Leptolyngbya sp. 7M]|uniref:zinc-binding dehydrogenase n=1 Tax=Leptolyngbya sp. 7M TaxID=2812896 RepID=UPI001B8B1620|nr:zinc-binding dehydrogenase [Leptolyngbya sp. 7M]QYO62722.1 zinc-binding dehydrogenase [Leptolyngbya sp. 7M]
MKAVIINRYGLPDVLQYADIDKPQIKPDQMLVKVYASSVNPIDWKIRKGMLKILTGNRFPIVLGFDVAGEVYLKQQIETGKLQSVIDRTYPLAAAAAAHTYSETGRAQGKVVITIAS